MKITHMKTNHMTEPIGFHMDNICLQWQVEESKGKRTVQARIRVALDPGMNHIVYEICEPRLDSKGTYITMETEASTRYYWTVWVKDDTGEEVESTPSFFETAREAGSWIGDWISPDTETDGEVFQEVVIKKPVKRARIYMSGVGLYEAYWDGKKIGEEYLSPNFNCYDKWIQFQTYCLEEPELTVGAHEIKIMLGSGWYKGNLSNIGPGRTNRKYGEASAAIAELHLWYCDETKEVIGTDGSWYGSEGKVRENSLFNGEYFDMAFKDEQKKKVKITEIDKELLHARMSLPVKVKMTRMPLAVIHSPKGETILDFGQNMTGWVSIFNRLETGQKASYQCGEILQDGCFYHDNYRTARAEFTYVSNGEKEWVRPHFTYYGFRYLKLDGFSDEIRLEDFEAQILYSDLEQTGFISTGNKKVNQLISNVLWGQRGNFLDIPTDCPQRDERLGWTGDAQVFSMTAAYNMEVAAFFRKYMKDTAIEQEKNSGGVPYVVPNFCFDGEVSAAWGDMATIIPWNLYLMYGDKELLKEHYPGMKSWVEYIRRIDDSSGGNGLWTGQFHFGDWLALDGPDPKRPYGATDTDMIATGYYYLSAVLTAKAAKILMYEDDWRKYQKLSEKIKDSFLKKYYTSDGRLTVDTQTAYVLALYTGLFASECREKLVDRLVYKLEESHNYLQTGFVGTPLLCPVLSRNGKNELACQLLLNEDYPSWLYCVNLGATTIWERWNSVLPDGHMNPAGMNSLNHYSYGAVMEWMYRYMLGINPLEEAPGFRVFEISPMPDRRLSHAEGRFQSCYRKVVSRWRYDEDGNLHYHFEIPFDTEARVDLPDTAGCDFILNGKLLPGEKSDKKNQIFSLTLEAGSYAVSCIFGKGNKNP